MKILQIIPSYKPAFVYGGPIFSVSRLCEELVKEGHSVTVFTTNANGDTDLQVETRVKHIVEGVSVFYFPRITRGHSNFSPTLLLALSKNAKQYDAIHIHSWWNPIALISLIICIVLGLKPLLSLRGGLSEFSFQHSKQLLKRLFHITVGKRLLRYPILHVTSDKEAVEVKNAIGDTYSSIHIIPNLLTFSIEKIESEKTTSTQASTLELVSLARIHPVKNLEMVIDSLGQVEFPFHFHIVGDGESNYIQQLKERARSRGILDKIAWHGKLLGIDKEEILRRGSIKILMSKTENFGNAIIEALAVGTPVLVSKTVGAASYVLEKQLGWVIDPNPVEIVKTLNRLHSDQGLIKAISMRCSQVVKEDFSGKNLTERYLELYRLAKGDVRIISET